MAPAEKVGGELSAFMLYRHCLLHSVVLQVLLC